MPENAVAHLVHGSDILDINSGNLFLDRSFLPPSTKLSPLISQGTAMNQYQGGELISEHANDYKFRLPIQVRGSSNTEIGKWARVLERFLRFAGDPIEPLVFEYRPNNDVPFEPRWGQHGGNQRFEIIFADIPKPSKMWRLGTTRNRNITYTSETILAPFARGLKQLLATGKGGFLEDILGKTDGGSRGLILPEGGSNRFTNPIFGFEGDWFNNWTADLFLSVEKNTDPAFVLFGSVSVKITAQSTGRRIYESIFPGVIIRMGAYVKLVDGSEPTSSDCELFYGSAQTTTFHPIGNGWYRAEATPSASGTENSGIEIKNGKTVYVDGLSFEDKDDYNTPLVHGDLPGCFWDISGDDHDSASTRSDPIISIPADEIVNPSGGTIRAVVKIPVDNTAWDSVVKRYVFHLVTGGNNLSLFFFETQTQWVLFDGTNSIGSGTTSFNRDDVIVFHAVWGDGSMELFVNGVSIGSDTYDMVDDGGTLYIGANTSAEQMNATFMDFATFDHQFTATEVAQDYQGIIPLAEDGDLALSPIPYLWTKDGDNVIDNCDDTTRDNFAYAGGIPGTFPAITEFRLDPGQAPSAMKKIWLSSFPLEWFPDPTLTFYSEIQGTTEGGTSGGEYLMDSLTDTEKTYSGTPNISDAPRLLGGLEFYVFLRMREDNAAGEIGIAPYFVSGGDGFRGEFKFYDLNSTSWRLIRSPALPLLKKFPHIDGNYGTFSLRWALIRPVAGVLTFDMDYANFMFRPMARLDVGNGGSRDKLYFDNDLLKAYDVNAVYETLPFFGDRVELLPGITNMIRAIMGDETVDPVITWTLEFEQIFVTPRWGLV